MTQPPLTLSLQIVLSCLLLVSTCHAQPTQVWTPESVLLQIQGEHPAIKAATIQSEGALDYSKGAGAQPNPHIRLALTRGTTQEDANSLTQVLEVAGQPKLRKKIATRLHDQAQQQEAIVVRQTSMVALHAYYDLWLSRRRLETAEKLCEHTTRLEQLAASRLSNGDISRDEYRRSKLERLSADSKVAQERALYLANEARFRTLLQLDPTCPVSLPDSPTPPTLAQLELPSRERLLEGVQQLPELQLARAAAHRKTLEVELAGKAGAPDLFVYAYRGNYSRVAPSGVQVGISFPLFDWGQDGAEISRKRAQAEAAQELVESERINWQMKVLESWESHQGRLEQVTILQAQVTELKELADHSLIAYEAGYTSLLDVLTMRNDYRTALLSLLEQSVQLEKEKWELSWLAQGEPNLTEMDPNL